jgi:signal transduction histidine kinase
MKEDLRATGTSLVAGEEEARRRIARELHDDHCQRLAALALELKALRNRPAGGDRGLPELDAVGAGLAELAEDLRRLSHDLHPAILERHGLAEALRDHCAEIERRSGLRVRSSLRDDAEAPLPPDLALGLYRIAQEAMANTVRHAGARTAHVTLRIAAGEAYLAVVDDGAGFDPGEARRAGGLGLAIVEERARLLGGRCRIASAPGAGAEIEVTLPLPAPEATAVAGEPIEAGPPGALHPVGRLVRRRRRIVVSAAFVILALTGGLVAAARQARRTRGGAGNGRA